MKNFLFFQFWAFVLTTAFAQTPVKWETIESKIASDTQKSYLYSPTPEPKALIVLLHGCNTSALEFDTQTRMSVWAQKLNFAVLYPEQELAKNSDRCWNWTLPENQGRGGHESGIIASAVETLQKRFHLSREKTFLAGMAAGAAEAVILSDCYRDLFSAVLIHSIPEYVSASEGSPTSSVDSIRFVNIHGKADTQTDLMNATQVSNSFLSFNHLIAIVAGKRGAAVSALKTVPMNGLTYGYDEKTYFLDGKIIGVQILEESLAQEWSGGHGTQPDGLDISAYFLHFVGLK